MCMDEMRACKSFFQSPHGTFCSRGGIAALLLTVCLTALHSGEVILVRCLEGVRIAAEVRVAV